MYHRLLSQWLLIVSCQLNDWYYCSSYWKEIFALVIFDNSAESILILIYIKLDDYSYMNMCYYIY